MKKKTLLYVPLLLLFAFAVASLVVHFSWLPERWKNATRDVRMPFSYDNGRVMAVLPEGEAVGVKTGDKILTMNGRRLDSNYVWNEELENSRESRRINLAVERKTADGQTETLDFVVPLLEIDKSFSYYARLVVGNIYTYFVPAFCVFVGFWVVFVRVHDPLAWFLLFIMLGFSCIGMEGYGGSSVVYVYSQIFFSTWALSMLLFGIYFPERLALDARFPWLKYIFIVPFGFQIVLTLLGLLKTFTGITIVSLGAFGNFVTSFLVAMNALGIGMFFAALGYKSGTLKNPDARRRLKMMVYGTSVAMLPAFSIILYSIVTGKRGSFFDNAPWWFALTALTLMLLFPLVMAYVIVVHRAMDVRVVVRQGLQYALASNGVRIIEAALVMLTVVLLLFAVRNFSQNISAQFAIVLGGIALIVLFDISASKARRWIDRKFFREAYNAEQILSDLSEQVRTMVETKPLLETVSAKISESLHVPQIALLLKNGDGFQAAHALGYKTPPSVALAENDKTVKRLKENEPLTIYQDEAGAWEEIETEEREKLQKLNSHLLLPIGAKNGLSGVISLSPKRSEEPYTPNDLRLLKSVAVQTGLALENSRLTEHIAREAAQKERLNRELEIAREVQERLFPQELPAIEVLDYIGACRPALGVGGDYYDFLELPDGKFGIAIGDVSGKGIGASLMMASLQASLRGQAIHCGSDLAELMKHVNTLVYEASTSNRYATFFYAQLDTRTKKLIYVNAGHNPPFLLRKSGEVLRLEEGGAVVGMLPTMFVNYAQGEVQLETGDMLVGYTDGISEAMNPAEEEWGEDAMLAELKNVYDKSSEEILHTIVACADRFADGAKQHDDMTMIIVKAI